MESGWSLDEAAPRLRSRLPNLNLLPAELVPMPLPWLTAGLALFALGLLMLLYALFYMKAYTDLELGALRDRLTTAQQVARELGLPADGGTAALPSGTLEDWAELRARQVDWASVFSTIASGLGAVQVSGVQQAGYTVSIAGEAATANDANQFLQKLRDSGLFASLEMSITGIEGPPVVQPTAAPIQGAPTVAAQQQPPPAAKPQPTVGPPVPPASVPQPPAQQQPPPQQPVAPAKPQQPVTQPAPAQPTLAPRTPLASPSPVGSVAPATPAAVATPLPAYDFIVQSKRETVDPSRTADFSHIRVRVVDSGGNLIPGLKLRVESEGQPPWGDTYPHPDHAASNGTFDVGVGMGKFTVFVMNGFSERATGLFTGVAGQPGVHEWDVTFTKVTPGAAPAEATCPGCSPTPTPTITLTPAPTATPISPGANLASQACLTASHGNDAYRAVDGNVDTAWESGRGPIVQITLDFTRYPNTHALACQPKAAGESRVVQAEAIELVARADGRSRQTHEVWTVYDSGNAQLEFTLSDVEVGDYTTLSNRFAATRPIQQLRIRTIRSGVNVGWREIRLFEPLPPAFGNVATPTPTWTPSPTPTAPSGALQFGSAQASSENPGNPAALAIDNDPNTFWRPVANQGGQYLQANFSTAQTVQVVRFSVAMGDTIATATATVGPNTPTSTPAGTSFRVQLLGSTQPAAAGLTAQDVDCFTQFVSADNATVQLSCSQPFSGVTGVRIYLDSIGNPAAPPGIRQVSAYPPAVTPTPSATHTRTPTRTPTPTVTPTQTVTPTPTLVASGQGMLARTSEAARVLFAAGVAEAAPLEQAPPPPNALLPGPPSIPFSPQQSQTAPVAVLPPQQPTGRVAFTIVGQVRPGGQ